MEDIQNTPGEPVEAAAPVQDNSNSQENVVPVHVVQSLRSENQHLKENMRLVSEHLELLKANQMQKSAPQDNFTALSDHDVLTVGDAKKVLGQIERKRQMEMEELKMSQTYTDYNDVIRNYLPKVLKEDPELRQEIENARNPYKMAYKLAKQSAEYVDEQRTKKKSEDAERIIANSQKTGSLSAVGTPSPITKASYFKAMSDDEFRKLMNKNSGRF
jgi:hypothetical protein